jgi:iron complex outermembrane receptor protein/outer membrane receptor for ferric coprogen and ferric-rhodotorulic acid
MLLPIAMVCSLATFSSAHAQSAEPAPGSAKTAQASAQSTKAISWNLPAAALDETLSRIARLGLRSISASPALLAGKRAPAVQGSYSVEHAAQIALAGSGLRLVSTPNGTLTVLQDSVATPASGTAAAGRARPSMPWQKCGSPPMPTTRAPPKVRAPTPPKALAACPQDLP